MLLQVGTLIAVVVGLGLTINQLRLLRLSHVDLHDWNRRKAAQDAINEMSPRLSSDTTLLDNKFNVLTKSNTIPLEKVESAISADGGVRLAIHKRLNYFESLALGVQQGVYDEEVIKNYYQVVITSSVNQFREYVQQMREDGSDKYWVDIESMSKRWEALDSHKPPRDITGAASIRARASEGG